MRARIFILGILIAWFLSSCEKINIDGLMEDFGLDFSTDYYEIPLIIVPAPAGFQVSFSTPMQSDMDNLLAARGYSNATITSIQMADASMTIDEKSNITNFNAVELITTSISTPVLPEEMIASFENTLEDAENVTMETPGTELADYLTNDEYILVTTGKLKEDLTDTLRIKGKIRYRISFNIASLE